MATRYSIEATGVLDGTVPPSPFNGVVQGTLRRMRATYNLASAAITTADNLVLGKLPPGAVFAFGVLTSTVTLGASATVAIGTNPVHASNGQYRAAAISTAVETPALFGITVAQDDAPSAAETTVYLTNGVANLPAVGVINIDIFYSTAN